MAQVLDPEKDRLIRRMDQSRLVLGHEVDHLQQRISSLKSRLDVPSRVMDSINARPSAWFASSLGVGFLATRLFRRKEVTVSQKPKRGIVALILAALFSIAKVPLKELLIAELTRRVLPAAAARRTR